MEKINLFIDLDNKNRFISKYNKKTLNRELKEYILNELVGYSTKDKLNITINIDYEISGEEQSEYIRILRKEFRENYTDLKEDIDILYRKSIILILIGVILLVIGFSFLDHNDSLLAEISNIGGWLLIWESGYALIYTLADKEKEARRYKQIVDSNIKFNKLK